MRPCAIVPDIGEFMKSIDIAEKGGGVMRVTAKGVQSARIDAGARRERDPQDGQAALGRLEHFPFVFEKHPLLGEPTINVGEIYGGAAPEHRAGLMHGDRRSPVGAGQSMGQVREHMIGIAREIAPDFEIEIVESRDPHAMDPDHPLVGAIQRNAEPVLGFRPETIGLGGANVRQVAQPRGHPIGGLGTGRRRRVPRSGRVCIDRRAREVLARDRTSFRWTC